VDTDKVYIHCTVKVRQPASGRGTQCSPSSLKREADIKTGKISVTSPIGKGLLGKKRGREMAESHHARRHYGLFEVLDISR
jgi:transcription elongation factor GreA